MKYNIDNISNSELSGLIDNWIHSERGRKIMKRKLIDDICFEPLSEEIGMSERQVREIFKKNMAIIARQIQYEADKKRISEISSSVPKFYCQTS